ncbi:ketoacyl-synt-domain-containing protein [Plenodomus tracheiphilus IPT5]|uniref:Ketoacyl-synt-domain-containing protein n=1 Tax=Plenodomus tracheiphilus IPT5 TaxID=1408161 RepID=A0A6A7BFU7_9PLEO|nr:ketoacyl-synt-domain-containing protein [Plenodomus tracheiphilus IPT5]
MKDQLKLYLFGDQTFHTQAQFERLLQSRDNPALESLLFKAYNSIRTEVYKLSPQIRKGFPRLTCLEDLVLPRQDGRRCIPLDMATTCLYHLGTFVVRADPGDFASGKACALGLCTGALAAAAVSCSRSTLDLIPLAVDAIAVAFRVGLLVESCARQLVQPDKNDQSWSVIVPRSKVVEAIDQFYIETPLPVTHRPYISASSPSTVTVSGPPLSLELLVASRLFKGFKHESIPIFGPYHAPHLYSSHDVKEIVRSVTSGRSVEFFSQLPVLSSTASKQEGKNFTSLLEAAVAQILREPIQWNGIQKKIYALVQDLGPGSFNVVSIGSMAERIIYDALGLSPPASTVSTRQGENGNLSPDVTSSVDPKRPKLAIIGMSGRFPCARSNEEYWDVLYQGLDVHKPVPELHWDPRTHVDPTGIRKNTSATSFGCWLDNPAEFDATFFNISPREAPQIDPAQRLALMTAYEAMEQAGLVPDATPSTRRDRVGVFYGVTSNDWMETNSAQNIDTYFIPGGNRAFIPGRINYCFKFSGPSYAIDTACSSSLAGIHLACNALWQGDIDTAISGGTNVLTNPDFTAGLDRGHFLSRTGNCKTFDDNADGYCRGEGIGTVIIKRLEDALVDKDPILGVISGAFTNHSAESTSITRPHSAAQSAIFRRLLNQSVADPYSISYVEMHGTGTQAGDAGEMTSVLETFAPPLSEVRRSRSIDEPLYLGSAKANIGHGEAASGVSSLIKVLLMMQKNIIVPHCGIKTQINRKFPTDLRDRNVQIATQPTPWLRKAADQPRRVFVNNFSAAGGNTALMIEDGPMPSNLIEDAGLRSIHLIAISAKTGTSLQGNLRSLLNFVKQNQDVSLGQLSYTTTARRIHHQHRAMIAGKSAEVICEGIEAALSNNIGMTRAKCAPKVIFTFTGQGAQYPGMGRDFFRTFLSFRNEMLRLDYIGHILGFPSVLPVIQSEEQDIGIHSPTAVQLASVCMQIALSKLWISWNIIPSAVLGHSLGEYAALNIAGVLSDAETIYAVGTRAEILQKMCTRDTNSMLVVKGSVEVIVPFLIGHDYEISCINSPTETVLSGSNECIHAIKEILGRSGFGSTLLRVPYAFHSSQMEPMMSIFEEAISGLTFSKPNIPVLRPLDGKVAYDCDFDSHYLANHTRGVVDMLAVLQTARRQQIITDQTVFIEIGPHPAVSGMLKAVFGSRTISLPSAQRFRSMWQTITSAMTSLYHAGVDIHWVEYHRDFPASHSVIPLPAYSWNLKDYWIQYINDWSLRKGDPPLEKNQNVNLKSTTIHHVVEETADSQRVHMVIQSDIAREDLSPLVQGHEVDGIPLCTPSVYADIALSVGLYLLRKYDPTQQEKIVDVSNMSISRALILQAGGDRQVLQAQVDVNWDSHSADMKFMSFDANQKLQEHGRCQLRFKSKGHQAQLQMESKTSQEQMRVLREGIAKGTTARFNRPMVYRMIRPLARFHDDYRAIDEIILDSNTLEASSRLSFGSVKRAGKFHTHPAIIDSLTQACGFAMNCNDSNDLDVQVFMNHGWGSFSIFQPLDFEKVYTTYTRMSQGVDRLWYGDVVVFDGETVVAFFGQIAIQGVPRKVLKAVLSIESGSKSKKRLQCSDTVAPAATKPIPESTIAGHDTAIAQSSTSQLVEVMSIIAEASGIAMAELTDSTAFADVGIDSLMGLTISACLNDQLGLDLGLQSFVFDFPTIGDLKAYLRGASAASTDSETIRYFTAAPASMKPASEECADLAEHNFRRILEIISEESGVAKEDLTEETNLADTGVDSLLSLVITSRLQDEIGLDINHGSLFIDCPTILDLKRMVSEDLDTSGQATVGAEAQITTHTACQMYPPKDDTPSWKMDDQDRPVDRKSMIDKLILKYSAGFAVPVPSSSSKLPAEQEKIILVTGATGSLGGNLVQYLSQLPDVKTVICLNRKHREEPYTRQYKAMRNKGIRFSEPLKPKLVILQADSSEPLFGLERSEYDTLVYSVTHLIHNAWPMSAKRPLSGFETQFQVLRNLIDFSCHIINQRPEGFKFSFQMISSIGVVGHYRLENLEQRTMVPEAKVDIDSVLPNGYSEAKWGCEQMIANTIQQHPHRFRAMIVRLGQIAGSRTSGYWNPMEHFGFLIKSSQTLNALPDVPGTAFWTTVNDIAATLSDLLLGDRTPHSIYHIENPVGQSWKALNSVLSSALNIPNLIPFGEWVERVKAAPQQNNPASTLVDFLDKNYLRMSCGGLVLDTQRTLEHSSTLSTVGPISEDVIRKYINVWKETGFLVSLEPKSSN